MRARTHGEFLAQRQLGGVHLERVRTRRGVRPPRPAERGVARLVSIGGGSGPVWAPDGTVLYYRGASGYIMSVPVTLGDSFTAGRPDALFRFAGIYRMSNTATAYDIHPDGTRFIMVSEPEDALPSQSRQQVDIVLNWFEELRRVGSRD